MSLLGTQVYANEDTPLWVSTAGGSTIDGDLTITGTMTAQNYAANDQGPGYQMVGAGPTVHSRFTHIQGVAPRTMIQTNDPLYFNQLGQVNGNTFLQVTPFSVGSPADQLRVGGTLTVTGTTSTARLTLPTTGAGPTAGKSAILVGQDNIVIPTTAVTANSIILITRQGLGGNGPGKSSAQLNVIVPSAQIVPGVSFNAFLVDGDGIYTAAATVNAEFSWVIIN